MVADVVGCAGAAALGSGAAAWVSFASEELLAAAERPSSSVVERVVRCVHDAAVKSDILRFASLAVDYRAATDSGCVGVWCITARAWIGGASDSAAAGVRIFVKRLLKSCPEILYIGAAIGVYDTAGGAAVKVYEVSIKPPTIRQTGD